MVKVKSLRICHVNVRSILSMGRLVELEILSSMNDIDILCVTETWLSADRIKEGASVVNIPGFLPPVRRDRAHKRGGVAIFVRLGLNVSPLHLPPDIEAVGVKLHLPQRKKLNLITVYRPPDGNSESLSSFISTLDSALTNLNSTSDITCLVGDFNAKSNHWWRDQKSNQAGVDLLRLMVEHGLSQMVDGPTRISNNSDASQIDLIFINDISPVLKCEVLPPIADHCPTILTLQLHSSLLVSHPTQQHKLIDFEGLRDHLSMVDWSPVLSTNDVNVALTSFLRSLSDALGKFSSPQKTASRRNGKPWFNQYLLRLRRQRDRLFHRSKHLEKDHRLSLAYRKIRNLYVAELRAAEKKYYIRQCSRLSSKRTLKDHHRWWGTAKSLCGIRTSRSLPTLVNNGSPVSSPLDKAECLNNFFAAQCTTMSAVGHSISPVVNAPTINATFSFEPVMSLDVLKKLKSLNPWKSPGPDLITNKVLKECAGEISLPLVHIFNCSLKTGIFPSSWKSGAVTPVFKCKGSRSDPKSYRPITLLPCLSKIFESFVRDQLQSHCLLNGALPDEQFGFLPKRSTVWQLLSIVDDWEMRWTRVRLYTLASSTWLKPSTRSIIPCYCSNYAASV